MAVDERRWRALFGSLAFWVIVAYFVLAAVVLALYFVNGARRRDEALHRGEVISAARSRVQQCLTGRPLLVKVNAFVHAVRDFHEAALENSIAILNATPAGDPTLDAKRANVGRLRATIPPVKSIHFRVPTRAQCLALGDTVYGRVPPTISGEAK